MFKDNREQTEYAPGRGKIRTILAEWGSALRRLNELEREIRDFTKLSRELEDTLRAQEYNGMPGSGWPGDPTARSAEMAIERRRDYDAIVDRAQEEIHNLATKKRAIDGFLAGQMPTDREIIDRRYRRGEAWAYIAHKTNYDESTVRERERKTIDELAKLTRFSPFI